MRYIHIISRFYFFAALLALALSCEPAGNRLAFELTPEETLSVVTTGSYWFSPQEARSWEKSQDEAYRFVDIRPAVQFDKGSLKGATNIPTSNLLDEDQLNLFSDGKKAVLFGATEEDAHGAWLLLRQMGYENTMLLQGGYAFLQQPDTAQYTPSERARYNYAALMAKAIQMDKAEEEATRPKTAPKPAVTAPKQIIPQKKARPKVEEEGC